MPLNENLNLETTSLIWLDNMADATHENREIQEKLRSSVNYLKTFENCQDCENYLCNKVHQEQDRIILIASGRLGQSIIDRIHHLKSIVSIFIYCFDKEKNEAWANKYPKVRGVIVLIDDLLKAIEHDSKRDEYKLIQPIEIISDDDDLIQMLLHINYTLIDRKQFLSICSKEYQDNLTEMENIQEFEHLYSSSKALNYFSKETFLYRLLIKALQIFNFDILFLLRFFLQDIEQQLKQCPTLSVPVYRGQFMTNNQIESMKNLVNKDKLRFNSFIIAKTNREQVVNSLKDSSNKADLNPVIFQIETNQIGRLYEQFVLFPITTQFRINSIEYQNNIYIVKIIVSNSNPQVNKKQNNAIAFGYRLQALGRLDDAEKIFHRILTQQPSGTSQLYDALARITQDKGLYETSLEWYKKSLSKASYSHRVHCLNSIGCIYDYLQKYEPALEYYSKALRSMKKDVDRAMCLNNIGVTLANQQKYEAALQSFEQSLAIREKYLPANHPDLGISLANMGVLSSSTGQSDVALDYYKRALKVFVNNSTTIYQAIVCQNMAEIFYNKNEFDDALKYFEQAAIILKKSRPSNNPNLIYIEHMIQQLTQTK